MKTLRLTPLLIFERNSSSSYFFLNFLISASISSNAAFYPALIAKQLSSTIFLCFLFFFCFSCSSKSNFLFSAFLEGEIDYFFKKILLKKWKTYIDFLFCRVLLYNFVIDSIAPKIFNVLLKRCCIWIHFQFLNWS